MLLLNFCLRSIFMNGMLFYTLQAEVSLLYGS